MGGKKETKEKPLDKMTTPELKEAAKEIEKITGVHGMNKAELLSVIKKARGIEDSDKKNDSTIRDLKKKIKEVKKLKEAANSEDNKKMTDIYRKRITRLKKKVRSIAL